MKQKIAVLVAVVLSFVGFAADTTNLIPPLKLADYSLELSGSGRMMGSDQKLSHNENWDYQSLRLGMKISTPVPELTGFVETEMVNVDQPASNWVRQIYLAYKPSEDLTLRAGRFFLAAPYWTCPPIKYLETVQYPNEPWSCYGWGVQTDANLGNGWNILLDITANSHTASDRSDSWNGVESSARLSKKFSNGLTLGAIYQVGQKFARFGSDFHMEITKTINLDGEIYTAKEKGGERANGGYVLVSYKLTDNIRPHFQLDYVSRNSGDSFVITPGFMLRTNHDRLRFIVDFGWDTTTSKNSNVSGVVQINF
jgi:hypothetical protein